MISQFSQHRLDLCTVDGQPVQTNHLEHTRETLSLALYRLYGIALTGWVAPVAIQLPFEFRQAAIYAGSNDGQCCPIELCWVIHSLLSAPDYLSLKPDTELFSSIAKAFN